MGCMQTAPEYVTERRIRRPYGRWQPHGPKNSLRKRVNIAATYVYRRVRAHGNHEFDF
jgi:hypothetical protein